MSEDGHKLTQAVAVYTKTIFGLEERRRAVTTTSLARDMAVTPSSASAMLVRLRSMGLIEHQPYSEATLTETGRQLALRVIRRRRLMELFLIESLGYSWDEVEKEAEDLECAASETFIERIAAKLCDPVLDPHGDPIPSNDGTIRTTPNHLLSALEPGSRGKLARVWNGDPDALRYLDKYGIRLREQVEVLGRDPFGGSIVIRVGEPGEGRVHGFGDRLADCLSIELDS